MSAGAVVFALLNEETSAEDRVYPLKLPQSNADEFLPSVTFRTVASTRRELMGASCRVLRVRIQVDAWAATYAAVRTLAGEIDSRLNRFRGIVAGKTVQDISRESETEMYESDTQRRRVSCDYIIMMEE
jgi:hypothetical protein